MSLICDQCGETAGPRSLVSGRPAVLGCASGTARVFLHPGDAVVVQDGDILVTVMTDPECTPAMRRAAAVVTDRGGVLCHAAIVCREFGTPCIVGAGNATVAIPDGKPVRVCATRGVVEILNEVEGAV